MSKKNAKQVVVQVVSKSVDEKLNDGDYKNKLEYPARDKFYIVENVETKHFGSKEFKKIDTERFTLARKVYNAETARLDNEFKTDALAELGITNNPRAERAYSIAYDLGHDSGIHSVWQYLCELVDLIK